LCCAGRQVLRIKAAAFFAALAVLLGLHGRADAKPVFPQGATWDWQLTAPLDLAADVKVFDLHPELVSPQDIAALKARGVYLICYVSIGTIEKTSPDRGRIPRKVIGKVYRDWPDERFLDIRRLDILLPLMRARFERCKKAGFDAIEPDNMDVHENDSGFPLSEADSLAYIAALAKEAHGLGLAIGQKNVPALSAKLVGKLDFAITESCFQDGWCGKMRPWLEAGKAVLAAEYDDRPFDRRKGCAEAARLGLSMILKDRDLTKKRWPCPGD
jgi:hypothetical protein